MVVINNMPVHIARTERELAKITLARDVRLFILDNLKNFCQTGF